MFGLDDDTDIVDFRRSLHCPGDVHGEVFLVLQPARKHIDDAGDLGQADDEIVRDIGHVAFADERQQVVLAQRVEFDILDHDHLAPFRGKPRIVDDFFQVLVVAAGQEAHGIRSASWCVFQSCPVKVVDFSDDVCVGMFHTHCVPVFVERDVSVPVLMNRRQKKGADYKSVPLSDI